MKSKYNTHVKPYMALIKSMRIDGLRELDIRKRLDVGHSAWADYKNKHTELMEALKISKETLIAKLEDTMYRQALNGNSTLLIFSLNLIVPPCSPNFCNNSFIKFSI